MQTDLVIQGNSLSDGQMAELASACRAAQRRRLGPGAARLLDVDAGASVADTCVRMSLDHAFVPATARLSDFGLVPTGFEFAVAQVSPVLGPGHASQGEFHD